MKIHELKTWPEFFRTIISGEKTFELRQDDRAFRTGDYLLLKEWNRSTEEYTGSSAIVRVTYVMGGLGLQSGWVCMGIKVLDWIDA